MTVPRPHFVLLAVTGTSGLAAAVTASRGERWMSAAAAAFMLMALASLGWLWERQLRLVDKRAAELDGEAGQAEDVEGSTGRLEAARQRLVYAERLAILGELAAGAAHEMNDPLAVTLSNLTWLREQATLPHELARPEERALALGQAFEAARRVADLVRDLREFALPRTPLVGGCDLVTVLRQVQRLLEHDVRVRANPRLDLPDAPLLVNASPARAGQLFAGLLLHAARSIEEGAAEANEVRLAARDQGDAIVVTVTHSGRSLPPKARAHLADPFHESWTQLGFESGARLALCSSLAATLHADLRVIADPEHGERYEVRLPHLTSEARLSLGRDLSHRPRLLVVDDEPLVCASLYRVLSRSLHVVPHTSPRQALAVLRSGEPFEAVLCDLMMPEMSGVAFLQELWRVRPALAPRLIFLTGGAFTPAARESLERLPNLRVEKPTSQGELLVALGKLGVRCPAPGPVAPTSADRPSPVQAAARI